MASNYNAIIANATAAYNKTLAGYQSTLQQQQQAQQGIVGQYNALQGNVLGGLADQSEVANRQINAQYTKSLGQAQMNLYNRGLGNSTVDSSIVRGFAADQGTAQLDRLGRFAGLAADKQTQLGLASLGYQGQALANNLQFAGQGLQYGGQGAAQLGNLAEGFAGLENQRAMQQAALDQQMKLYRLNQQNQLYGVGRGGGAPTMSEPFGPPSSRAGSTGGGIAAGNYGDARTNDPYNALNPYYQGSGGGTTPYGGNFGGSSFFALGDPNNPWGQDQSTTNVAAQAGWQPYNGEDLTGYSYNGESIG